MCLPSPKKVSQLSDPHLHGLTEEPVITIAPDEANGDFDCNSC